MHTYSQILKDADFSCVIRMDAGTGQLTHQRDTFPLPTLTTRHGAIVLFHFLSHRFTGKHHCYHTAKGQILPKATQLENRPKPVLSKASLCSFPMLLS